MSFLEFYLKPKMAKDKEGEKDKDAPQPPKINPKMTADEKEEAKIFSEFNFYK